MLQIIDIIYMLIIPFDNTTSQKLLCSTDKTDAA